MRINVFLNNHKIVRLISLIVILPIVIIVVLIDPVVKLFKQPNPYAPKSVWHYTVNLFVMVFGFKDMYDFDMYRGEWVD